MFSWACRKIFSSFNWKIIKANNWGNSINVYSHKSKHSDIKKFFLSFRLTKKNFSVNEKKVSQVSFHSNSSKEEIINQHNPAILVSKKGSNTSKINKSSVSGKIALKVVLFHLVPSRIDFLLRFFHRENLCSKNSFHQKKKKREKVKEKFVRIVGQAMVSRLEWTGKHFSLLGGAKCENLESISIVGVTTTRFWWHWNCYGR